MSKVKRGFIHKHVKMCDRCHIRERWRGHALCKVCFEEWVKNPIWKGKSFNEFLNNYKEQVLFT